MEKKDLIQTIQSSYGRLTKSEKKVADYCLSHGEEIAELTITELGKACGVAASSVHRFCRSIRLQGYQELRMKFFLLYRRKRKNDWDV